MSDLATFLLARIAEDEATTFELIPYRCEPGCCAPPGWVGHRCLICNTEEFGGTVEAITDMAREHDEQIHRRSHVLAECEAKRRIVESIDVLTGGEKTYADRLRHSTTEDARYVIARDMLRLLALPYADHPDYRDEWRP